MTSAKYFKRGQQFATESCQAQPGRQQSASVAGTLRALLGKAMLMVAFAICMVLGVIGLLLPVLPGFVFFLAGIWLLTLLSRRVHQFVHERTPLGPWLREQRWHRQLSGRLTVGQRLRLLALYGARSIMNGVAWLFGKAQRS
jgi:uncharacterized membrane protein YbaN (DUF454 family)